MGNKWSVPIATGLANQFELLERPTRFLAEIDYYVVQLDDYGPECQFRALLGIILPPLFGN